ncbi:MAG: DUF4957 domain-containing protein [Prevotella sp.]|nr:DUF4957 domain-containing protein [Prevotella sp.]
MKKTLFAVAALVAGMSASAEVTPRTPVVPWGAQAEIIATNDLTAQGADGKWRLSEDAQKWIVYDRDGVVDANNEVQQTNRPNVWFNYFSETTTTYKAYDEDGTTIIDKEISCDEMIIGSAASNWGGYLTVTSKTGSTSGLIVVGKARYPHFYVTGTDKAKFYFSGSASTAGYPQIEVYEEGNENPIIVKTGDIALTKSTWDKSTLLIADGLDKSKNYEIVCRTMNKVDDTTFGYEGGDIVLQVVKLYGDVAPMREDGLIISGSEIGSYINAHLAAYPEVTDFILEGSGKYTIKEGITAAGKFTLSGVASAPATIDASALAAPFVGLDATQPDSWTTIEAIKFANVKVTGLAQALFASNTKNYLITNFAVDNSVIEVKADVTVFDFTKGSAAENFTILNSTLYATTTTTKSLYSSQSGQKVTEAGDEYTQTFTFNNNTIFNFAKTKNFFTHRQSNQKWLTFNVKNNIFMDCGKQGQVIKGMNGGQSGANPTWTIDGNTFLWSQETAVDETTAVEIINTGESEETGDAEEPVQNSLTGVPFTAVPTNNFTVAASSQQAKYMTGDPRWLVPYATDAIKIEVDLSENTDFVAVLNEALANSEAPSSIEISFWEAGEYPTTGEIKTNSPIRFLNGSDINAGEATIVVKNGMTLGGQIEFNGVNIDATGLEAPVITLAANEYKLQSNGFYNLGSIQFKNMSAKGLAQQLVYGNKVKNQISELLVENSNIDVTGCTKVPFDFNGGGAIGAFNIKKSTVWAANPTEQSLFSTQSGNKATEAGYTTQNIAIDNSTLYNIAKSKNFFTHRQSNQTWLAYYLRNSVFVNVGKSGQVVKGINQGQSGANPKWTVTNNIFNFDGADTSADESTGDDDEPVQNSVAGVIAFENAEGGVFNGAFTLVEGTEAPSTVPGDPRWTIEFIQEPVVAGPYYLVGNFTGWAVDETYSLQANTGAAEGIEEYMITLDLEADAQFKVVKVDGESQTWYPDGMGNNYGENGELTQGRGNYTVYFRPNVDGNEDWFYGVIYVAYNGPAVGINAIAADNMKNATYYNLQGVRVAQPTKGLYIVNGKKVVIK